MAEGTMGMYAGDGKGKASRPETPVPSGPEGRLIKFRRLIDAMEMYLDSGFFLSMVGKIIVDEKKLYSILSELRTLQFEMEADAKGSSGDVAPIRKGASNTEILDNFDQTLQKMMVELKGMQILMRERLTREVKQDGSTKI